MPDQANSTENEKSDIPSLERIVEAFEDSWLRSGNAHPNSFLPSQDHPQFYEIVAELLCVDIERRWRTGHAKTLDDYRDEFPQFLGQKAVLERVAFEEYRLLLSNGTRPDPSEYSRRLGISTLQWPRLGSSPDGSDAVARCALADGVADEMGRIVGEADTLPKLGECFLGFQLVEQLGECKFGSVFLARQKDLSNRQVVIKVTSNLWSESDRLSKLQHTNIVPIYSVHQHKGFQAVCMPFMGRRTLSAFLDEHKKVSKLSGNGIMDLWLSSEQASGSHPDVADGRQVDDMRSLSFEHVCVWIMASIASGLDQAHMRGILHRDLKPDNILLTDEFQPMILDFNLSEDAVAGGRSSLLIGGTLPYMAPEHLLAVIADGTVDERSDIYSLGVIFFQLLTGQLPFRLQPGSTIGKLSYLINDRYDVTPTVKKINSRLSTDVETIVLKCLSTKPDDRYQTARDLREDLERHLRNLPLLHAANRSTAERARKWIERHPRASSSYAIGMACTFLVAVMTCFLVIRGNEVGRLNAQRTLAHFRAVNDIAATKLNSWISDEETTRVGLSEAKSAIAIYSAAQTGWKEQAEFRRLPQQDQRELATSIQRLHYLIAAATQRRSKHESTPSNRQNMLETALRHNQLGLDSSGDPSLASPALLLQRKSIETDLGRSEQTAAPIASARMPLGNEEDTELLACLQSLQVGDYATAQLGLLKLQRERPKNFFVWFLLGQCNVGLNRLSEASDCFTSCIALWPEFYVPHFHRGLCRMKSKRNVEAERDFTETLRLHPTASSAMINRAIVRMERQNFQGAIADLTSALDEGQQQSFVHLLRSRAWSGLGENKKSARDLEKGKELTPTSFDGWIQRSSAFRSTDAEQALCDLNSALVLRPHSKKALQNKAALLSTLQRNQEALDPLSKLVQQFPGDATFILGRGLLKARLGMRDSAVTDGKRGVEINNSAGSHYHMARILAQTSRQERGDAPVAIKHLKTALRSQPQLIQLLRRDPDLREIAEQPEIKALLLRPSTPTSAASELRD